MGKLYWLAGLLEGEGCFCVATRKGWPEYHNPRIRLSMTDKDIVVKASMILFGKDTVTTAKWKNKKYGHKLAYTIDLTGAPAMDWMIMLYPLMGERRQAKIKEIHEQYQAWLLLRGKHRKTTPRYLKLVS